MRVRVFEDYSNLAAIKAADFLVTYTCDVTPEPAMSRRRCAPIVARGGRWYALHGTNSILRFLARRQGRQSALGAAFHGDPGLACSSPTRRSRPTASPSPTRAIRWSRASSRSRRTTNCTSSEYYGDLHVLLETEFEGEATGSSKTNGQGQAPSGLLYQQIGKGAVLYLTLGHCRGHYDMQPLIDFYPVIERCAWDTPTFYELLRRGIAWAKQGAADK